MVTLLVSWLTMSLGLFFAAKVVSGVRVKSLPGAIVAGGVYGLLQLLLGKILFFVIGFATLGLGFLFFFLTLWVVSALLLKLADEMTDALDIDSFGAALKLSFVMSVLTTLLRWILPG